VAEFPSPDFRDKLNLKRIGRCLQDRPSLCFSRKRWRQDRHIKEFNYNKIGTLYYAKEKFKKLI
jgi:hypothetical protein